MQIELLVLTRSMVKDGILSASESFTSMPLLDLKEKVNGCGASGAKFDFIPETMYGLYIGHACFIHDLAYAEGKTDLDKQKADKQFLGNLLALIEQEKGWKGALLRLLRKYRAMTYYDAVVECGASAYWLGKVR